MFQPMDRVLQMPRRSADSDRTFARWRPREPRTMWRRAGAWLALVAVFTPGGALLWSGPLAVFAIPYFVIAVGVALGAAEIRGTVGVGWAVAVQTTIIVAMVVGWIIAKWIGGP